MAALAAGAMAPDFSLTDLDGAPITLAAFREAPLIINFFDTDCSWCRTEMSRLAETYARHDEKAQVAIIDVAVGNDTAETARSFAADKGLNFPIAVDAGRSVRQNYQLERVPTIVFIDEVGTVQRVYEGSTEQLSGIVEQALLAAARGDELPELALIGNGCAP